jgi:predicted nucleic acid-binding protein
MASAQPPLPLAVTPKLIVADAGPLIALAVGGVLPLCLEMLGGLSVPEAVLQECIADVSAPGALILQALHRTQQFQIVATASLAPLDAAFAAGLGGGEIAVLAYAKTHGLLVLIDERRARRVAERLKVAVIGSGTVVAQLKRQGRIDSVQPVFAAWGQHGYFISEAVKRDIQRLAGSSN